MPRSQSCSDSQRQPKGTPFMKSTNSASWILITGTSTGIGRAATFTLAENGYRVLAAVRKQEDVESLLVEAATRRVVGAVEPIILDVTDAGPIAAAVEIGRAKIAAGGRLHAIVNNAGAHTRPTSGVRHLDTFPTWFCTRRSRGVNSDKQ